MSAEQYQADQSKWHAVAQTAVEAAKSDTSKQLLKSAVKVATVGFTAGIAGVMGVTLRHHREQTHQSIKLSERLQKAIDLEQKSLGVAEPYTWASVHRIHHQMEDTTLYPFYRIYHALQEAQQQGIDLDKDKRFKQLDPFVESFDLEQVIEIGKSADILVQQRLGSKYKKPVFKNNWQLADILQLNEDTIIAPQYQYPEHIKKHSAKDYTPDELARILLTDPHSPALMKRENGVQGVALSNISLYSRVADAFRHNPSIKPLDLQKPEDFNGKPRKSQKLAVVAGFAVPIAAMLLWNRDFTPKGLGKAIIEGSAINGIRTATEIFGGNATNSAGHMGDPIQTEIAKAFLNQRYDIKLKADGTVSTNTVGKGIAGRLASWATLDEVGGQQIHHQKPWKIAYTDEKGRKALVEAPWGSFLAYLADNKRVSFIQRGDNFSGQPREDVVHEAVKKIQQERAKQLAATA